MAYPEAYKNHFFRTLVDHPELSPYASYFWTSSCFERIGHYCILTQQEPADIAGITFLDIAGGHIGWVDHSSPSRPTFFPWMSTGMAILGAQAYCLDQTTYEDISTLPFPTPQETAGAVAMSSLITMIPSNLAAELRDPMPLLSRISDIYPQLSKIDIINCSLFVTHGYPRYANSPALMRALGIPTQNDVPTFDTHGYARLSEISAGIVTLSLALLKEQGHLYFNNMLYRRQGDKLVWIPSLEQQSMLAAHKALQGSPAMGPDQIPYSDGTHLVTDPAAYVVQNGIYTYDVSTGSQIEPVP